MALITPAEARLLIDSITGTAEDANLSELIDAAGGLIAAWCGYPQPSAGVAPTLESTAYTLYLDGPDPIQTRRLRLPVRPITAVASIHDDQSGTWSYGASDLVDPSYYVTTFGGIGEIWLTPTAAHTWGRSPRGIKVVCTAGFATVPAPLKQACRVTVRWMWERRRTEGYQSLSADGFSSTQDPDRWLPHQARLLLGPYRQWGGIIA